MISCYNGQKTEGSGGEAAGARMVKGKATRTTCTTTHLMLFPECLPTYASCMTISGGRTEQHVVIGFGELVAVD